MFVAVVAKQYPQEVLREAVVSQQGLFMGITDSIDFKFYRTEMFLILRIIFFPFLGKVQYQTLPAMDSYA